MGHRRTLYRLVIGLSNLFVALVAHLTLPGCCAEPRPDPTQPQIVNTVTPSPTIMDRLDGGYSLVNGYMTVVIAPDTGDACFWSSADNKRNRLYRRGIFPIFSALPPANSVGHVEKRDDQTWQYYGTDSNNLIWRKIYNLDDTHLFVSYMVENATGRSLVGKIEVAGDLPATRVETHDPELFIGNSQFGSVKLQAFNEHHNPSSQPVLPILVESDTFRLRPRERQSFTTQWMLGPHQ